MNFELIFAGIFSVSKSVLPYQLPLPEFAFFHRGLIMPANVSILRMAFPDNLLLQISLARHLMPIPHSIHLAAVSVKYPHPEISGSGRIKQEYLVNAYAEPPVAEFFT